MLSRENNGVASDELLAIVRNALNDEDVRPVADRVAVQSANVVDYKITASLYLYPGPESEPVLSVAKTKLQAYITAQHRLGCDIRKSAIYAALHVEGMQRVELAEPVVDTGLSVSLGRGNHAHAVGCVIPRNHRRSSVADRYRADGRRGASVAVD